MYVLVPALLKSPVGRFPDKTGTSVPHCFRGMQMNGQRFGLDAADLDTLVGRLRAQMIFLCEREQKVLTQSELEQMRQWIGGDEASSLEQAP
jgi:hypothetical protein